MADTPDSPKSGFLRKVVRFAMNPTTDWADLNRPSQLGTETDLAKAEIKAMIERKRRNDFVRKREFDMLRKIRREGLSGEGLADLEGLSHLEDSEVRISEDFGMRTDQDVKDKIDAIERQMVGDAPDVSAPRRPAVAPGGWGLGAGAGLTTLPPDDDAAHDALLNAFKPTRPLLRDPDGSLFEGPAPSTPLVPRQSVRMPLNERDPALDVEVTEVAVHDPELDEAVMAFASADDERCEEVLRTLIEPGGTRARHSETWLVLFDLYRATGQQWRFDSLAGEYAERFGSSPPQWYSLPQQVADAAAQPGESAGFDRTLHANDATWVAPETIDPGAIRHLRSRLASTPLPWVIDWQAVLDIEVQACVELTQLMQEWADRSLDLRWIGGGRLLDILADIAPMGARAVDPSYWMLRMEALRLAQRPNEFDQAALDYCMTYEVSPPSWMPARCTVKLIDAAGATQPGEALAPSSSLPPTFNESMPYAEADPDRVSVDLNGQLLGDIGPLLNRLAARVGSATQVQISCARLIRMDFIAAGDLLNWVLARKNEGRAIQFVDAHRLVALFCGAMGLSEQARVTVRKH